MTFDITQVLDLQSFQVQSLLGWLISWTIKRAVESNLPVFRAVTLAWARWLSIIASGLVALGIHMSWMGGWTMASGGTVSLTLMVPSLSDLVNAAYQFVSNEINYRVFHKRTPALELKS